ncbi:MAG: ROK family protein [Desulfonatronovibrio sp.]
MYISIDLGGTNLRGTWIDKSGRTGEVRIVSRPKSLKGTQEALSEIIKKLKSECPEKVREIGLASAGPMDFEQGVYLNPTNMPELKDFNLKKYIANTTGLKVILENDAQAAALGEIYKGCLAGEKDAMVFTLGTGLGSGVIIDRKIWRGKLPAGPELGHLYLGPGRKVRCGCGQVGCAETWLNSAALKDLARQNRVELDSLKQLDNYLLRKDAQAIKTLEQYGHRLGLYLCQVAVVFGITNVALGGGLSRLGPYFIESARKTLSHRLFQRKWLIPEKICCSPEPEMSALWGMCFLMTHRS